MLGLTIVDEDLCVGTGFPMKRMYGWRGEREGGIPLTRATAEFSIARDREPLPGTTDRSGVPSLWTETCSPLIRRDGCAS